ncbi:MAG: class I SAM-dependent methyltransferase, partial [Ferroplasma sp.]
SMSDYYIDGEEKFGRFTTLFYDHIAWHFLTGMYNFALDNMENLHPESILDIGAGPGRLSVMVAKKFPSASLFAIDPSLFMVKTEAKNFGKYGIKGISSQGSSRDIPFKNSFDLIFTSLSFHHWADREKNIQYILSKLNKNGTFMIIEYMEEYYKSTAPQKKHSLSKKYADSINFDGFEKKINVKNSFIALSFTKIQ